MIREGKERNEGLGKEGREGRRDFRMTLLHSSRVLLNEDERKECHEKEKDWNEYKEAKCLENLECLGMTNAFPWVRLKGMTGVNIEVEINEMEE